MTALRAQLEAPGWKRNLYEAARQFSVMNPGAGCRSNAELWLARDIKIPAYGGHYHHFFCVDGERLEVPPGQSFVPGPYRCSKCGRQYQGERYEAALRRLEHGWLAQAALDLALVGAIEQDRKYSRKAAEILLKYADAYPGPHTSTVKGGMIYQSLDEAMWVIPLAQAYDLAYPTLTLPERQKIVTFLRKVALGIRACGTHGNWGSWHLSSVGVVGYAIADIELTSWATAEFKRQIRDELGDDGLWPESVHTYHYFPLLAFIHFAEACWHAGVDLYHWEAKPGKTLLSMFSAPLGYAYPDLRLPAINDGWFQAYVPADCYELAFARTGDPRFGWVIANGYRRGMAPAGLVPSTTAEPKREGLYAFLFGREVPSRTTAPSQSSVNFPGLGICVLRSTNGSMLTFDYGPFLGHGQPDKMGITLFTGGKLWMADYGTPGYGAAILPWYSSTRAHNTIIVDGHDQQRTRENHVELAWGEQADRVESETREAYPGVIHRRTVLRRGDVFIIHDLLSSTNEHTYELCLHCDGELSLAPTLRTPQPGPAFAWVSNVIRGASVPRVFGTWTEGRNGVRFWLSGTGQISPITGDCPAETGTRRIPIFIARQIGKEARFVTVLGPEPLDARSESEWRRAIAEND